MKTSFKDSETLSAASEKTLRESIAAKDGTITRLQAQYDGIKGRINRFIASVDSVQFDCNEEDAPLWASQWGAYLLSGKEPRPPVVILADDAEDEDLDTQSE